MGMETLTDRLANHEEVDGEEHHDRRSQDEEMEDGMEPKILFAADSKQNRANPIKDSASKQSEDATGADAEPQRIQSRDDRTAHRNIDNHR